MFLIVLLTTIIPAITVMVGMYLMSAEKANSKDTALNEQEGV
jgi:ABC-type glycerol-3-phosphate transport system permease component